MHYSGCKILFGVFYGFRFSFRLVILNRLFTFCCKSKLYIQSIKNVKTIVQILVNFKKINKMG